MLNVRIGTDHVMRQSASWQAETTQLPRYDTGGYRESVLRAVAAARIWRSYDVVISANVRNALMYGLLKRIMPGKKPRLMLLEARFDDPKPTLGWQAKVALQRFAFAAVDIICVSARREIVDYARRLELPESRFQFIPWHTNVLAPAKEPIHEDYVLAAGRTGRDWSTLASAAERISTRIVVVASRNDAEAVRFPPNVIVHCDIPYQQYSELLRRARIVLLPLQIHSYSSGQVALLEAMALGKPVVCSRVLGTEDYITNMSNGLLVPPANPEMLAAAVNRILSSPDLEARLGDRALQAIMDKHTFDRYASRVLDLARQAGHA